MRSYEATCVDSNCQGLITFLLGSVFFELLFLFFAHSDLVPAKKEKQPWGIRAVRGLPWATVRRLRGGTAGVQRREVGQKSSWTAPRMQIFFTAKTWRSVLLPSLIQVTCLCDMSCPFGPKWNDGGYFRLLHRKRSSLPGSTIWKWTTKGQLQTDKQSSAGQVMARRSISLDPSTTGSTRFLSYAGECLFHSRSLSLIVLYRQPVQLSPNLCAGEFDPKAHAGKYRCLIRMKPLNGYTQLFTPSQFLAVI